MKILNSFQPLFEKVYSFELGGISVGNLAVALLVLFGLIIVFKISRATIIARFKKLTKKTNTNLDNFLVEILEEIHPHFYWLVSTFIAFQFLHVENEIAKKWVNRFFIIFVIFRVIRFAQRFLGYLIEKTLEKNKENETALHGVRIIANVAIWVIGIVMVLHNLGLEIDTLIASLGIGGIAIAFAFQKILVDLFSSFAIYFDKPFKIGDYVVLGNDSGNIKKIGFKTTRIKTLRGEELIISNTELTSTRIKNLKKMKKRRADFSFGVMYTTPSRKLQKIPKIVKDIIKKQKLVEFSRCHFKDFGDFSLNFEVVYFVLNREYGTYMDIQQAINFAIKDAFEKEKIEMAFPTQTIHVEK